MRSNTKSASELMKKQCGGNRNEPHRPRIHNNREGRMTSRLCAVLAALIAVALAAPALAQTIRPYTAADLYMLETGPNYTTANIEDLIRYQVRASAVLIEEVLKEFGIEVVTTGLGTVAKAVKIFKAYGEIAETGAHCKSEFGAPSIVEKNNEIGIARENVIKLEEVLYKKYVHQYPTKIEKGKNKGKDGKDLYFEFIRSSPIAEFQYLNVKKISQPKSAQACSTTPSSPPPPTTTQPAQPCDCKPPTRYSPTPEGGRESEAATNAWARCMTACRGQGGIPPVRQ